MKMNALTYMIKYLPCLLVNVQAAIHKKTYFSEDAEHFGHGEPTTIYIVNILNLHYRSLLFSRESS